MSHQSGIAGSVELRNFFANSKDGSVRLMKVMIKDETLALEVSKSPEGSSEEDYDKLILPLLEPKQPCYILYRLDSKNTMGYEWIFITYSPDHSHVRQKMLYASTRATLKQEFGSGQIKEDIFGTTLADVNLDAYRKHVISQDAPPPLTMAEEELSEVKRNEVKSDIGVDTKHQTIAGVAFPISEEAMDRLRDLQDGALNYVQLSLDMVNETVILVSFEPTEITDLASRVPKDQGRYHFFMFKHTHEGDYLENIVFIYSMPGYKCSIKERMLYSSCKQPLLDTIDQALKMDIVKKIEIDDGNDLTEEFIYEEVHPKKTIVRPQFSKPKGPGGRGPRRMTKPAQQD